MEKLSKDELTKLTTRIAELENQYDDFVEIKMYDYNDEEIYLETHFDDGGIDNVTLDRKTLAEV